MKTTDLAGAVSPLALMGYAMTPAERAKGRYMRAPDGHEGGEGGGDTSGGGAGSDTMQGGAGSDTQSGGAGSDTLAAGAGSDTLAGGAADDKDWRTEWAGDDGEVLKFLGRHASPAAAVKEFKKIHGDLRSGKYIKPLDENSTDAEKAAWAKMTGVPEKPEAYGEKLPDGLVVGDDDKPAVDSFFKAAHDAGLSTPQAHAVLQTYYDIVDEQTGAQIEANDQAKSAAEEELRGEWGADYKRNLNVLKTFTDALPDDVGELLHSAVGADGVQLMNKPGLVKWLMSNALEANPLATVVPGAGSNQASAVAEELATIRSKMGTQAYIKDEKMQARYRELVAAQAKLKGQGG